VCKINDIFKRPEGVFVSCTSTDADFMRATSINIRHKGKNFILTKFVMGERRQCFNLEYPIAPLFMPEENTPDDFLQVGNEVAFSL
jgi:hypothetical protein